MQHQPTFYFHIPTRRFQGVDLPISATRMYFNATYTAFIYYCPRLLGSLFHTSLNYAHRGRLLEKAVDKLALRFLL